MTFRKPTLAMGFIANNAAVWSANREPRNLPFVQLKVFCYLRLHLSIVGHIRQCRYFER